MSACKKDGVEFKMSLIDFADSLTPDDLDQWAEAVNDTAEQTPAGDTEGAEDEKS